MPKDGIPVHVVKRKGRSKFVFRWVDPVSGQPREQTSKYSRRREAERKAAALSLELAMAEKPPERLKWDSFWNRCIAERLGPTGERNVEAYQTAVNHLQELLDPEYVDELDTDAISRFSAGLRASGLSEGSITSYLNRIQALLEWGRELGLIFKTPSFGAVASRRQHSRHMRGRPITAEEFERMLAKTSGIVKPENSPPWQFYLRGLFLSGLRLSESLELWWDREDKLHLHRLDGRRPMMRIWEELEKGRKDRLLPITPDFVELLRSVPRNERSGPVFILPLSRGSWVRYTRCAKTVSRKVSAIGEAAGVITDATKGEFASAHDLRRSFGARWSRRVRAVVLKELMRHENLDTTMKFYVGENAELTANDIWEWWDAHSDTSRCQEHAKNMPSQKQGTRSD